MRRCSSCERSKPHDAFGSWTDSNSGYVQYRTQCNACRMLDARMARGHFIVLESVETLAVTLPMAHQHERLEGRYVLN